MKAEAMTCSSVEERLSYKEKAEGPIPSASKGIALLAQRQSSCFVNIRRGFDSYMGLFENRSIA